MTNGPVPQIAEFLASAPLVIGHSPLVISPMSWSQNYAPLGSPLLSAAVSALPVVLLLALLGGFHVRALYAALASLVGALVLAITVFGMPPALALGSAGFGAAFGLFPIGWIVLNGLLQLAHGGLLPRIPAVDNRQGDASKDHYRRRD